MYNLDDLTASDLKHMKRYIGELVFLRDTDSADMVYTFLKSWNNGEAVLNEINLHEITEIFSEKLFLLAQETPLLLDFYADTNSQDELYNIKKLTVYDKYYPQY